MRSGERVLFRQDRWVGDRTLAAQFSDMFNCAVDKEAKVKANMATAGGQVVWCPFLRRNLKDHEESQFLSLHNILKGLHMVERGLDVRVWTASKDVYFSVSSFFSALSNTLREKKGVSTIWMIKAPLRVVIFGWMASKKNSCNG